MRMARLRFWLNRLCGREPLTAEQLAAIVAYNRRILMLAAGLW